MLLVLSPAKTLDYESLLPTQEFSQPRMLKQSQRLIHQLRLYSPAQISKLMKLSDKLASINSARYESWELPFDLSNARQALLAFKGDVYRGLSAYEFQAKEFDFAQSHLRILSGLYGVLRPLDLIAPYRLEMGTKLGIDEHKNLYQFWANRITDLINQDLKTTDPVLINLASNEYFSSINTDRLKANLVTPVFKEKKNGQYKIVSFHAKYARGLMAQFIIKNQLKKAESIKNFNSQGYEYNPDLSTGCNWVFTRDQG